MKYIIAVRTSFSLSVVTEMYSSQTVIFDTEQDALKYCEQMKKEFKGVVCEILTINI